MSSISFKSSDAPQIIASSKQPADLSMNDFNNLQPNSAAESFSAASAPALPKAVCIDSNQPPYEQQKSEIDVFSGEASFFTKQIKDLMSEKERNLVDSDTWRSLMSGNGHATWVYNALTSLKECKCDAEENLITYDHLKALVHIGEKAKYISEALEVFRKERKALATSDNFIALVESPHIQSISAGLQYLSKINRALLSQNLLNEFVKGKNCPEHVVYLLRILEAPKFESIRQHYCAQLASFPENACPSAEGLVVFLQNTSNLAKIENIEKLIGAGKNACPVADSLRVLADREPLCATQENFDVLIESADNAEYFHQMFRFLSDARLLTQENFEAIIEHAESAEDFQDILRLLSFANLLTQDNFDMLIASEENPATIYDALKILSDAHLLTQDNYCVFMEIEGSQESFTEGLLSLSEAGLNVVTQENVQALFESGENARDVGSALMNLANTNASLLTEAFRSALISCGRNAEYVADVLDDLIACNPALVTQSNLDALLAENGAQAQSIGLGTGVLLSFNPALLDQNRLNNLIRAGENAEAEAAELVRAWVLGIQGENLKQFFISGGVEENEADYVMNYWAEEEKKALIFFILKLKDVRFLNSGSDEEKRQKRQVARSVISDNLRIARGDLQFKRDLIWRLNESTDSCGDRTSVGFVYLEMARRFHNENRLMEKYEIAVGMQKVAQLETIAKKLAEDRNNQHEEIETFLKLLIECRNEHSLPFDLNEMQFEIHSQVTDADILRAKAALRALKPRQLASESPYWQNFLFGQRDGKRRYEELSQKFDESLESLAHEASSADYVSKCNTLKRERKEALELLALEITDELFNAKSSEEEKRS